jgi:hypothetical protein
MHANATTELVHATESMIDESIPLAQRERRLHNARENHKWTSRTLLHHLDTCVACRARESALRPAYKEK